MSGKKGIWHLFLVTVLLIPLSGCSFTSRTNNYEEARALAEEAYIFAFPMFEHYRTMQLQAIGSDSFNRFRHAVEILGPEHRAVVRPNNDTLYSTLWLDLRAEPMVLILPPISDRYYSFQFVDMYTHNFAYAGLRSTGTEGGIFLIAGPEWSGDKPSGVDVIFQSEGDFVLCLGRTALDGPEDLGNVHAIQQRYVVEPLSTFLGTEPPPPSPMDIFPLYMQVAAESVHFISYLNFLLGQLKIHPSEEAMIERFSLIGIGPSYHFDAHEFSEVIRSAVEDGIASALEKIAASSGLLGEKKNGWTLTRRIFGNREQMQGLYLIRAGAARIGLYGNDLEEAYYPSASLDADEEPLDASEHSYVLRFSGDEIPPVDGFWSVTMYCMPDQLLVENSIDRYSIGDRTRGLVYGADGSLELYFQKNSPGGEKERNWLPAPDGPFALTLRMYLPKEDAISPPLYAPQPIRKANR